jgi:hypothetical protein
MLISAVRCLFLYHPKTSYGGRVVVPQKTGNAVPRRGRMRDFGERGSPANLVVLKSGERSSASLGGRTRKTVDSLSATLLEVEKDSQCVSATAKSSHRR